MEPNKATPLKSNSLIIQKLKIGLLLLLLWGVWLLHGVLFSLMCSQVGLAWC